MHSIVHTAWYKFDCCQSFYNVCAKPHVADVSQIHAIRIYVLYMTICNKHPLSHSLALYLSCSCAGEG